MAATISLCLSNSPLLVLLNEVMVMASIRASTLFPRDLGDRGSSIRSSEFSFLVFTVKASLTSSCTGSCSPSSPSNFSPSASTPSFFSASSPSFFSASYTSYTSSLGFSSSALTSYLTSSCFSSGFCS